MSSSRSFKVLARLVIAGMVLVAGLVTAALLAQALLSAVLSADTLTYGQMTTYFKVHGPVALAVFGLLLLGSLGTGVAFVAWLYRARRNLDRLPGVRPRWPRGAVFVTWLVPGANLVTPAVVVADVARTSAGPRAARLAWAWWVSCVGSLLVTAWQAVGTASEPRGISFMYGSPSDRVDPEVRAEFVEFIGADQWVAGLPIAALLLAAAVFGAQLVGAVTAAQRRMLAIPRDDDEPPPASTEA